MNGIFYLAGIVAIIATALAITRPSAVHALLYLVVSLLSVALILYVLGAPFIAALEVIVYAGAIVVLFVFVVMMLNLGPESARQEKQWLNPRVWVGPGLLAAILIVELIYALAKAGAPAGGGSGVDPQQLGMALLGPYLLVVELASMLLLAGLVAAYHLGRRGRPEEEGGQG